ncbi:hypothetical protein C2869_11955 [Saccharobesus litoralis]|uniref:Uncharacterized protein n=1 Tax=Saccharobesus litoralis TaxID=2172099 RepID=A0A2S0VSF3_9ALTE|nr:YcjX family protein [Saccharobesus litoralis]AWB67102.1 hypothetical protein C2869_11955 [Saccharobesus litoralis]
MIQIPKGMQAKLHSKLSHWQNKAIKAGRRALDVDINLAVTGLSGAGKTAFISGLVHHLRFASQTPQYPFWQAAQQGRLLGCKRNLQRDYHVQRFRYDEAIASLCHSSPTWPASTQGTSSISLSLKYKTQQQLKSWLGDTHCLNIKITDYPGEWLLDLPLLRWDFKQWCEVIDSRYQHHAAYQNFKQKCREINWQGGADERVLESLSTVYTQFLLELKQQGYSWIQPGRFVLPSTWQNTPALHFVPLPIELIDNIQDGAQSLLQLNMKRYAYYVEHIVKPFYVDHFSEFDRQVILVDGLSALNLGQAHVEDLQYSLNELNHSFRYGKQSWLSRLLNPKIDKVLFAASKADQITPDQYANYQLFIQHLSSQPAQELNYSEVEMQYLALSAIKASQLGSAKHEGQDYQVLTGQLKSNQQTVCLFPGEVPKSVLSTNFWQHNQFDFASFLPPTGLSEQAAFPHIAMDKVCEFLLGDKLQ